MNQTTPETRRARKPHICSVCVRRIDPGETYTRQRVFDGGDAWTFQQCAHCSAVTAIYDPRDDDGAISSDAFAWWIEDRPRDWAEAKAMASWRMGWRRRASRSLLPIPKVES